MTDSNHVGAALRKIAETTIRTSVELCDEAFEPDGTYYVPVVIVCAINNFHLLASTLHFDMNQPPEEIARLLRMTADHLEGKSPSDQYSIGTIQ